LRQSLFFESSGKLFDFANSGLKNYRRGPEVQLLHGCIFEPPKVVTGLSGWPRPAAHHVVCLGALEKWLILSRFVCRRTSFLAFLKDAIVRRLCECLENDTYESGWPNAVNLSPCELGLPSTFSSIDTANMRLRNCRTSAFAVLLLLVRLSTSMVIERQDVNLTALSNATDIVNSLQYTANCTTAKAWHDNLPLDLAGDVTGAGSGNNPVNIAFLRSCLPLEYQNLNDTTLAAFYDDMATGPLESLDWLGTAVDDVETVCLAPKLEHDLPLAQLNTTQNCTATAEFLSGLGWLQKPQPYNSAKSGNDSSWLDFIYYALPPEIQENITDVELDVYYDHIATSYNDSDIFNFLNDGYNKCSNRLCEVQGYTGNPDIGGIGVSASPTHLLGG
jgi:hypothetical protein